MMRFRKMAWLMCWLLGVIGLTFVVYNRNQYNLVSHADLCTVRERLQVLSPQEIEDLTFFVNQAISFESYPYTLVGYKPMSFTVVLIEDPEALSPDWQEAQRKPLIEKFKQGYLVWKKSQSLFPKKKQIVIDYSFLGQGRKEIAVISPNSCLTTIQENLNDFQEVLGRPCLSEEVFSILTHPEHNDFYTIINHERLFGILLGFGRNNACLYELYKGESSRSLIGHPRTKPDPLQMFSDEWPWPGRKLLPCFACDSTTEETKQLKNRYQEASKFVYWTYFLRNDLEVTFALLMQN